MKYKNYMYSCKFFWPPRLGSESRLRIRITQQTQIKNKNQLCEFGSQYWNFKATQECRTLVLHQAVWICGSGSKHYNPQHYYFNCQFFHPGSEYFPPRIPNPHKKIKVADPGCLSRIPDPTFFHPGSELSPSRIPDPNCLYPGSASRN
jgi:hypothetical protein